MEVESHHSLLSLTFLFPALPSYPSLIPFCDPNSQMDKLFLWLCFWHTRVCLSTKMYKYNLVCPFFVIGLYMVSRLIILCWTTKKETYPSLGEANSPFSQQSMVVCSSFSRGEILKHFLPFMLTSPLIVLVFWFGLCSSL